MAVFYVDTSTSATTQFWSQLTELDGREYVLQFRWNPRAEAWFLDVFDQDGSPIVNGVRLVSGFPLARQIIDARKWPGTLACVATTLDGSDPGIADLGTRVVLLYDDGQPIPA